MSERAAFDAGPLPTVVFGNRHPIWWGTLGFVVIEGFTLSLTVAAYLYLRTNEFDWPPGRTPQPGLLVPTLNLLLLLLIIIPMQLAHRAAKRFERVPVGVALAISAALAAVALGLRWFELMALQVRWDAHAYASAAWGVVLLHTTLLVTDVLETGTLAALFLSGHAQRKHYPDASDAAGYQWFLSLAWIPLYLVIYWGPRLL